MAATSDSLPRLTYNQRQGSAQFFNEPLGNDLVLKMVLIPAGTFIMGSPEDELGRTEDEGPQHEVRVPAFCMGKYPVTQAQWQFVASLPQAERELKLNPSEFKGNNRPVERVNWYDAVEFCDRLSAYTSRPYRLPTEAEWEYACRAGTTTPFHFGETITTDLANYCGDDKQYGAYGFGPKGEYREETTPVDHFAIANTYGLCDMHGNVWEWCQDHWHDSYEGAPTDGSAWLSNDEDALRVLRGGSCNYYPRYCRSVSRDFNYPLDTISSIGFRVVCRFPMATVNKAIPILIVDDYKTMRSILRKMLNQIGFNNIDEAIDGQSALTKLKKKDYGLIISDWNMGPMSGYELLQQVRTTPKTRATPFILMTAEARTENLIAAKKAGVSGYIVKPFNADILKTKLAAVIGSF